MTHRVFVDSNVLASRTLRDWIFLLRLQTPGMFQLHSTPDVIAEAIRAWRRLNPTADGGVGVALDARIRENLDEVLMDFRGDIPFAGSDPDDQHVHAAAVWTQADILLTANHRDFGDPDDLPYEIQTPDEFLVLVDNSSPTLVRAVVREQNDYWQNKRANGHNVKPLDQALVDAGCPEFASRVLAHLRLLSGVR